MKDVTKALLTVGITAAGVYTFLTLMEKRKNAAVAPTEEEGSDVDDMLNEIKLSQEDAILAADTTGDGKIDTIMLDTTGDGEGDTILMDTTGDGQFDTVMADTTGDGMFDSVVSHR